jgi:hypothetical protein
MKNTRIRLATLSAVLLLTGCGRNPNVEAVGSYFPGWLLCLAVAIVVTVFAHYALRRLALHHHVLGAPLLIYPGMVLLLTCLFWLCVFA